MKNSLYYLANKTMIFMFLIGLILYSCNGGGKNKKNIPRLESGEAYLDVPGGKIWYKVSGTPDGIPVVLLNGGPGFCSYYLKSLEGLGNERQVIRYDHMGSGKSDFILDSTMLNIQYFVNELELLRKNLKIDKWHVLGHSWGTILAIEYYKTYPAHVFSLIFESPCFDIPAFASHTKELLSTLPESMQQAVIEAEASGNYEDPAYQQAINEFYRRYVFREPNQADLDSSITAFNTELYMEMQGPSEVTITGTLKEYNATHFLSQIAVPTLFTVGEFDVVDPAIVKSFANKVHGSRYAFLSGSANITSWDAAEENLSLVRDFLNYVDSRTYGN